MHQETPLPCGPNEYEDWLQYFAKQCPTADAAYLHNLAKRMILTLTTTSPPRTMSVDALHRRLVQLKTAVNKLPPDSRNKLMGG